MILIFCRKQAMLKGVINRQEPCYACATSENVVQIARRVFKKFCLPFRYLPDTRASPPSSNVLSANPPASWQRLDNFSVAAQLEQTPLVVVY